MTPAFVCVLLAYLAGWIPRSVVRLRSGEEAPEWMARLAGVREGGERLFAPFAVGVIVAHLSGVDERQIAVLAIAHVVTRFAHPWLVAGKIDYLAAAVWAVGFAAMLALYCLPWLVF